MARRRSRIVVLLLCLIATGCATEATRGVLHFGVEDAPEGKRLLWPPPPEVPRYAYAGTLTGEDNFKRPEQATSGVTTFLRWIAGLDDSGRQKVVLQRPAAGVVDEAGRIYVTDVSRQAVFVFGEKAGTLEVWDRAIGLKSFVTPIGIALGPSGQVLVCDAELAFVVRLDREGNPVGTIGAGQLVRPTGLARDAKRGLIFVSDTYAHDIKVFDDAGRLVQIIGRRGEGDGEFNYPTHLAYVRDALYVTDTLNNRIQVFSAGGEVLTRKFGERGLYVGNLVRPKGVAVDGDGHVYVIESYYDNLLVFNGRGEFLMPIGGTGAATGRFYLPAGVWTDERNRVFVADMFNGRVVVFSFLGGD